MERWTGSAAAGIVAGCLYAFNAHLLTRFAHLQAMHMEFFPIVLYAFDRLLEAAADADRGCLFGAHVRAAGALLELHDGADVGGARSRPWSSGPSRGGAARGGSGRARDRRRSSRSSLLLPFLLPYYRIRAEQHMARSVDEVQMYSATWRDYLTTAGRMHFKLVGGELLRRPHVALPRRRRDAADARRGRSPALAWRDPARAHGAGLRRARRSRCRSAPSCPATGGCTSTCPLLQGIRAAARWGFLFLIAIAMLAGFAVARLQQRWQARWWWPAFALHCCRARHPRSDARAAVAGALRWHRRRCTRGWRATT